MEHNDFLNRVFDEGIKAATADYTNPDDKHRLKPKRFELRMYFFVAHNLSSIQQGIQAGHAALEYADKFGNDETFIDFVRNWKTWIILNGGTTNNEKDVNGIALGTLNQIADELEDNEISYACFHEPELNNALTALCFIVDERVFNYVDYPDFVNWLHDIKMTDEAKKEIKKKNPTFWLTLKLQPKTQQEMFPEYYKEWIEFFGGNKNVYLRELLKNKELIQ